MSTNKTWPEGVTPPLKYRRRGKRCVPFYVRQLRGPVAHDDGVIWSTGETTAKSAFLRENLKDNRTAYLYELAAVPIDPEGKLALTTRPDDVNMKIAREWWAEIQAKQAEYREQQGLNSDESTTNRKSKQTV